MSLSELVHIKRRFLRSVNIVKDQQNNQSLDGYVVTPLAQQALDQITTGLKSEMADRAFTITGPYGTGKSSFALFLYYLVQFPNHAAWDKLSIANDELANDLHSFIFGNDGDERGFVVLPITARRVSITVLLAEALEAVPKRVKKKVLTDIDTLYKSSDSKTVIRLVEHIAKVALKQGYKGLIFVFDEFGKVFEEAYYNKKNTDIFILQELAETASRSKDVPILFLGMLHQSFGDYVDDIHDTKTKNEFSKIEGRFQSISFVETPAAQIQLLANAFEQNKNSLITNEFKNIISDGIDSDLNLHTIAGLSAKDFCQFAKKVYPLHPLTMIALPLLFRRFGQNERSIFTYLISNESFGFQTFLNYAKKGDVLRLVDLYDYLLANYETQLSRHPQGKIFLEANDVIKSKPTLEKRDCEILKSIAILTALGRQSHLTATESMIRYAVLVDFSHNILEHLLTQSIIVYRKFNNTYAIWEGSDVDLLECGEKADKVLGQSSFSIAEPLKKYLQPKPVIAKRHSFKTGALRYFDIEYVDSPDNFNAIINNKISSSAVGRIIVCLANSDSTAETFVELAIKQSSKDISLLFAIPQNIEELKSGLREIQRLKWIEENIKELRDDRIARREVAMRSAEADQKVKQQQFSLLDPRPAPHGSACQWIWNSTEMDISSNKDVSILLSHVCDTMFPHSLKIRNEMICKRKPSNQAAGARNNLIKRLNKPENIIKPKLGIEGFPPERSIYESILFAAGMHRQGSAGWTLSKPNPKYDLVNLSPTWKLMEREIFTSTEQSLPLLDLYAKLSAPPYGVMDGILPILLTAFYSLNRNEVTLYCEESFLADPKDAHFELMVRRPDLFAIAGAKISGLRLQIVKRLATGLGVPPAVCPIVRYLYKWLNELSRYAKNTNRISNTTASFRQATNDAKSPEKLLFVDLPKVFGLKNITEKTGDIETFDKYFELLNKCIGELSTLLPNLISEQRSILLNACNLSNSNEGWNRLYERACFLAPRINNTELIPFLQNIINTTGDWNKADAVMGYMVSVPLKNWGPLEIERFPTIARGKAELFIDTYQPYSQTTAALTQEEQKQTEKLQNELLFTLKSRAKNNTITRAALIACLKSLEKEDL